MTLDLKAEFEAHRAALLRHCYRMIGSFADAEDAVQESLARAWQNRDTYGGDAPVARWLFAIATNTCLNALAKKKPLLLPQLESDPADTITFEASDPAQWLSPAPDAKLFAGPDQAAESRETVALAFIALLQRLPPRQRAALLLKDVLGWSAEEIGRELDLTASSVSSALHRARETLAAAKRPSDPPPPDALQALLRAWESHDLEALVTLLREDVILSMPPFALWLRGVAALRRFVATERFEAFWSSGLRLLPASANGNRALAFYRPAAGGVPAAHTMMVVRFVGEQVAEMTAFVGPRYFAGFGLPPTIDRTISPGSSVITGKGAEPMTEPKTVALSYIEACGRGDFDAVAPLLAPEVHFTGPGRSVTGAAAYLAVLRRLGAVWKGSEVRRVFADGDDVCVVYDFVTDAPTASKIPIVEWVKVHRGQIADVTLFFDRVQFAPTGEALARLAPLPPG